MTTDRRGRAWLVWQGFHDGQADIFARCCDANGWHEPVRVGTSKANDWDPVVAVDTKEDRVWVGWDTYDTGSYGVRVRSVSCGERGASAPRYTLGDVLIPEASPYFAAHVSLTCDRDGRLWAAWDESGANWGKDYGYLYQNAGGVLPYASRRIRVKYMANGKWSEPALPFESILPSDMKEFNELPQLQEDTDGRIWMAFRHRTARRPRADGWAAQGRWDVYATAFLGDRWLAPVELPQSGGRNDMRTASQRDPDGNVYFAYAGDNRAWQLPNMLPRNSSLAVSRLANAPKSGEYRFVSRQAPAAAAAPVHPNEKEQVARIRGYTIEAGGKTYHIYRGDLHRHTDISGDG